MIGNSKSSTSTNTKKVSTNKESLRNKKLRLDRKYAHDPSYLQNRTSKVIHLKVLEGSTNTYTGTKIIDHQQHIPVQKKMTIIAPKVGTDTMYEGIGVHTNNNK